MTIAIQRLYDIVGHFARFSYTRVRAPAFAEWGASSQLGFGAKLVRPDLISVGSGVTVGDQVWLNARDDRRDASPTLIIGDNTYIGRLVQVNAWRAVRIGRGVLIADRVFISDADHHFSNRDIPIKDQGDAFMGAVTINDGCWIGIGAVILPGVEIGRNAVVGANAVVTRNVPDFAVVGGVPARRINPAIKNGA